MADEVKAGFKVGVIAPDGSPYFVMDDALAFAVVVVGRDGVPQVRHNARGVVDAMSLLAAMSVATVIAPMVQRAVRDELRRIAESANDEKPEVTA